MSRIDTGKMASDIVKEVDVFRVIQWIQQACIKIRLIQVSISDKEMLLLNSMKKWFEMAIIDRKTQKTI